MQSKSIARFHGYVAPISRKNNPTTSHICISTGLSDVFCLARPEKYGATTPFSLPFGLLFIPLIPIL